ncbi:MULTISPECIES: ABC transporter ATP-binding protein [Psychrobacillus]|uniref:ABC transporter ATP-binding protein n=1 Tax=Psychrobacillus faecigallinarum TaxID=2762235 RepID=A0ABR8R934_9BACI|nr:ABC transporter ATP-binding protein [Psychrobacillus faecigallinarum]MBD7944256.1 ABC transporter ATP-binding protein [Psychrobacillus faecigallinarum]QGM31626.1 ATP-binding cassette domain-containing protein [Bacillus sp. N3536]
MLKVNNVEAVYSKIILALKGTTLQVPTGDIVALLGSNGAGKSTTLKAISGLLYAEDGQLTDGTIEFEGRLLKGLTPDVIVRHGIFLCMEGRRVFKDLTVEENLMAGAFTRKDRSNIKKDIEKIYGYFPKLQPLSSRKAGFLSGGEQQMLAIGRGIMAKPKLLLLDEPSLGIAPLLVKEIFQNIKQINKEEGTSILVVEQNANVALSIADYGYIMENGRVVLQGDAPSLLSNTEVKEHYLGIGKDGERNYRDNKEVRRKQRMVW